MLTDNQPPSPPRMAAIYASGTVRARRWHGEGDVRSYRPPSGWTAHADLTDIHPITGRTLARAVWWIIEKKSDAGTGPRPGVGGFISPGAAVAAPGVITRPHSNRTAVFVGAPVVALKCADDMPDSRSSLFGASAGLMPHSTCPCN